MRPLYDDSTAAASDVTRDYHLVVTDAAGRAPVLSVYGGKLTTYRRLAEHALEKLAPWFPTLGRPWTATAPLPGGDLGGASFAELVQAYRARYPKLDPPASSACSAVTARAPRTSWAMPPRKPTWANPSAAGCTRAS